MLLKRSTALPTSDPHSTQFNHTCNRNTVPAAVFLTFGSNKKKKNKQKNPNPHTNKKSSELVWLIQKEILK